MFKNHKKVFVLAALIWPLVIWGAVVGMKTFNWFSGASLTLEVRGYDPRDLLSGHYLQYEVEYGVTVGCGEGNGPAYVYHPGNPGRARLADNPPAGDSNVVYIAGSCQNWRFRAGIERFYVPEEAAQRLDAILRGRKMAASIEVSVRRDGTAQVKDFLLNGKPWRLVLKEEAGG